MTDIQKQLADALEQRDALRVTLEVIALGDSQDPAVDAADTLADLGIWDAECLSNARKAGGLPTYKALKERWPEPQYDERQRQWCRNYEATTDFEPLMDDYEAGHETFVQAAQKSVQWYEDHTNDAYLAITREEIPGSEFDHGIKGE